MDLDICVKLFAPFATGTLYAGFSGGADSTAALLAALHFRERSGCRLIAVHFDHGLRGEESQREACEAEQFAAACRIEVQFACTPYYKVNLYNEAKLPTAPFAWIWEDRNDNSNNQNQ